MRKTNWPKWIPKIEGFKDLRLLQKVGLILVLLLVICIFTLTIAGILWEYRGFVVFLAVIIGIPFAVSILTKKYYHSCAIKDGYFIDKNGKVYYVLPKEHCYGLFREGKAPDECFSVSWPPENDWTGIWGREDI